MVASSSRYRRTAGIAAGIALAAFCGGCFLFHYPSHPALRVHNAGEVPINGLVLFFPSDSVEYGNVASDAITGYKRVPGGVFRYAAFRFMNADTQVVQPVEDWVGELPMIGEFTYSLQLVNRGSGEVYIALLSVTKDRS